MERQRILLRRVRWLLAAFVVGLVLSGLTAVPLEGEIDGLCRVLGIAEGAPAGPDAGLRYWLATVRTGLHETHARYPFIAYGTDWLAFAHVVIAVAFIGPLRDPVRNLWVITFGMIACAMVLPMALIFGAIREIPPGWRLIDCAFGVVGMVPLWLARRYAAELAGARS